MAGRIQHRKQKALTTPPVGREFAGAITLSCGHQGKGPPRVSNPDQWFCPECRGWKGRG